MKKFIIPIYSALIGFSILIAGELFIPVIREFFKGSPLFLLPIIIFSLLGMVLTFMVIKETINTKLKKRLFITGLSSSGFFIFILLHNVFYGLGTLTKHIPVLTFLLEGLHVIFFITAIFICPLGFLIGVITSMVYLIKKSKI